MSADVVARLLSDRWDDALEAAVRSAADVADAPVAFISLHTPRLALFTAHVGLPPELEISRATTRDRSLCRAAVDKGVVVHLKDLALHPEVRPELVDDFPVRALLCVPLRVGFVVVGALGVLDQRPRTFTAAISAEVLALGAVAEARLAQRYEESVDVDVDAAERLPYLRLLLAAQVGALSPEAMIRALRVLPPVPVSLRSVAR